MSAASLSTIRAQLRSLLPEIRTTFGVSGLWLFGSFVREENREGSDLDVLVEFERPGITLFRFIELEDALSKATGVEVDLVQANALKPRIRENVLREAQPI